MNVGYSKSFIKVVEKLSGKQIESVRNVIKEVKNAQSLVIFKMKSFVRKEGSWAPLAYTFPAKSCTFCLVSSVFCSSIFAVTYPMFSTSQ